MSFHKEGIPRTPTRGTSPYRDCSALRKKVGPSFHHPRALRGVELVVRNEDHEARPAWIDAIRAQLRRPIADPNLRLCRARSAISRCHHHTEWRQHTGARTKAHAGAGARVAGGPVGGGGSVIATRRGQKKSASAKRTHPLIGERRCRKAPPPNGRFGDLLVFVRGPAVGGDAELHRLAAHGEGRHRCRGTRVVHDGHDAHVGVLERDGVAAARR